MTEWKHRKRSEQHQLEWHIWRWYIPWTVHSTTKSWHAACVVYGCVCDDTGSHITWVIIIITLLWIIVCCAVMKISSTAAHLRRSLTSNVLDNHNRRKYVRHKVSPSAMRKKNSWISHQKPSYYYSHSDGCVTFCHFTLCQFYDCKQKYSEWTEWK